MLNRAERMRIFNILKFWSIVGPLRFRVDVASRRLNVPSRRKQFISLLSYSFFVLHGLYKNGSLAYAYLFVPDVELHQLVIHAAIAMASAMCSFWLYSTYVSDPALFFSYVNMTLLGKTGGPVHPKDELEKDWTRRIREYSLQDLIAITAPYLGMLAVVAITAAFVYDPSMRLLLYAALPSHLQNWATFGLCLLEEIRFLLIFVGTGAPSMQIQVISFDFVTNKLRLALQRMEKLITFCGRQSLRETYGYLRSLQLYLTVLNNVNMDVIFVWKLFSISCSVLCGYAAIAHFLEYPIFGVMYYVILFDVTVTYTVLYEKAFKIPELFGQVARCALFQIRGSKRGGVLRRQFQAIPCTGIHVGQFHMMERASTLIYIDFVIKNVVNMLVAYG